MQTMGEPLAQFIALLHERFGTIDTSPEAFRKPLLITLGAWLLYVLVLGVYLEICRRRTHAYVHERGEYRTWTRGFLRVFAPRLGMCGCCRAVPMVITCKNPLLACIPPRGPTEDDVESGQGAKAADRPPAPVVPLLDHLSIRSDDESTWVQPSSRLAILRAIAAHIKPTEDGPHYAQSTSRHHGPVDRPTFPASGQDSAQPGSQAGWRPSWMTPHRTLWWGGNRPSPDQQLVESRNETSIKSPRMTPDGDATAASGVGSLNWWSSNAYGSRGSQHRTDDDVQTPWRARSRV